MPLVIADWDATLLGVWNKVQADTAQQTCQEAQNNEDEPTLPSCTLHVRFILLRQWNDAQIMLDHAPLLFMLSQRHCVSNVIDE